MCGYEQLFKHSYYVLWRGGIAQVVVGEVE